MKYYVEVTRIAYARQTVEIEDAESKKQARAFALERAPEETFSTYDTEYEVSSVEAQEAQIVP